MKTLLIIIFLVIVSFTNAQDPQLFQYTWRLESITTANDVFTPSPNPDPNTGTFDHIWFYDQAAGGNYYFEFGVYGSVIGHDLMFSGNHVFDISFITLLTGESTLASLYMVDHFLFETQTGPVIYNPFSYDFRYENNLIYLDITNSVGSVATFYDDFLSQQQFLEDNISIYPNPVKERLHVDASNVVIQKISVYDLQGRAIVNFDNFNSGNLDLSSLSKGVYILDVQTRQGSLRQKLIKQ